MVDTSQSNAKRCFDLAVCLAGAIPAGLICVVLFAVIRIESRGPAIFRQLRYGKDGTPFTVLKLRTMRIDTDDRPSHENDGSEITRVGHLLRRLKLDEVPQLWNVLKGEMSLVGPRPSLTTQAEVIARRTELGVHALRPGITGPSQIAGITMSEPSLLAATDAEYLGTWRLTDDFRLLIQTVTGAGRGDPASSR